MVESIFLLAMALALEIGVGGWAYILKYNKIVKKDSGRCKNAPTIKWSYPL